MAVDSRDKRGSVIGIGISVILPLADGSLSEADRVQTTGTYMGIIPGSIPKYIVGDGQWILAHDSQYYRNEF